MIPVAIGFGTLALGLGAFALWLAGGRWFAAAGLALGLLVAYVGLVETMSRPKPVGLEFTNRYANTAKIIAYQFAEPDAIYLWLELPGQPEPRSYVVPWSIDTAEKMRGVIEGAAGEAIVIEQPFQHSWHERESLPMHPDPQPMLPSKPGYKR